MRYLVPIGLISVLLLSACASGVGQRGRYVARLERGHCDHAIFSAAYRGVGLDAYKRD